MSHAALTKSRLQEAIDLLRILSKHLQRLDDWRSGYASQFDQLRQVLERDHNLPETPGMRLSRRLDRRQAMDKIADRIQSLAVGEGHDGDLVPLAANVDSSRERLHQLYQQFDKGQW